MKRIITVLILTLTMIFALAVSASATGGIETDRSNVFEEIYDTAISHSDTILSALAFIGSLVLAIAYRKGMLPLLRGGIGKIGEEIGRLKSSAEAFYEGNEKKLGRAYESIERAEGLFSSLSDRLAVLEEELAAQSADRAHYSEMRIVMGAQIDMLYEIFMASSLPAYQKESVGEKICEMKRALAAVEADGNE